MGRIVNTGWLRFQNGQIQHLDLTEFSRFISAKLRWRGVRSGINSTVTESNSGSTNTTYPALPSGSTFNYHTWSVSGTFYNVGNASVTVAMTYLDGGAGGQGRTIALKPGQSASDTAGGTVVGKNLIGRTVGVGFTLIDGSISDVTMSSSVQAVTVGYTTTYTQTYYPRATVEGLTIEHQSELANGVETDWYDLPTLDPLAVTSIQHVVPGSGLVDVMIEFNAEPILVAPERHGPEPSTRTEDRRPWFELTLTAEPDNSASLYHARVRISGYVDMQQPIVLESVSTGEWEYRSGDVWLPFPAEGVPPGTRVRASPVNALDYQGYYWDAASHDGVAYGEIGNPWPFRVMVTVTDRYSLIIGAVDYIANNIMVFEAANGAMGSISFSMLDKTGEKHLAINWGDEVLLGVRDRLGQMEEFRGIVTEKHFANDMLTVACILQDGIMSDRVIETDLDTLQDVGLTAKQAVDLYGEPLTTDNINTNTGYVASLKTKGKTLTRLFEELRMQYDLQHYVDVQFDAHLFRVGEIQPSQIRLQYVRKEAVQ